MMNNTGETMALTENPLLTDNSFITQAVTAERLPVFQEDYHRKWPQFGWCLQYDIPILTINLVVGIIGQGNWIFILSIIMCKSLRSPFNLIVVIKALGDGIFTILDVPINITNVLEHFDPRKSVGRCEVQVFVKSTMYNMSMLCHASIAMVRLFCVVYKFKLSYKISSLLAFLILVLPAVFSAVTVSDPLAVSMQICRISLAREGRPYHLFTVAMATITFIMTIICYIRIYIFLNKHAQNRCLIKVSKYEAMTTWTGLCMTVIFLASFILPYCAKFFPEVVQRTWKTYHVVGLARSLIVINTGLSPIVYYYTLQSRHKAIVAAWRRFLRRGWVNPRDDNQASSTVVRVV